MAGSAPDAFTGTADDFFVALPGSGNGPFQALVIGYQALPGGG